MNTIVKPENDLIKQELKDAEEYISEAYAANTRLTYSAVWKIYSK